MLLNEPNPLLAHALEHLRFPSGVCFACTTRSPVGLEEATGNATLYWNERMGALLAHGLRVESDVLDKVITDLIAGATSGKTYKPMMRGWTRTLSSAQKSRLEEWVLNLGILRNKGASVQGAARDLLSEGVLSDEGVLDLIEKSAPEYANAVEVARAQPSMVVRERLIELALENKLEVGGHSSLLGAIFKWEDLSYSLAWEVAKSCRLPLADFAMKQDIRDPAELAKYPALVMLYTHLSDGLLMGKKKQLVGDFVNGCESYDLEWSPFFVQENAPGRLERFCRESGIDPEAYLTFAEDWAGSGEDLFTVARRFSGVN